jgi:hypothetical protein
MQELESAVTQASLGLLRIKLRSWQEANQDMRSGRDFASGSLRNISD